MKVAQHQRSILTAEVHAVSLTESECFAVFAGFAFFHPTAVSIGFEFFFPNTPEGVFVYIALVVFTSDGSACRDGAIDEDRGYADARGALV